MTTRHFAPSGLGRLRCAGPAWLAGWFVAVFLPSALIAFAGLSARARAIGSGSDHMLRTTWQVADDVGPAAKLLLGLLLALLFLGCARIPLRSTPLRYLLNAMAGVVAIVATLGFIPAAFSRGFGIGLTGLRFDPAALPFYIVGGLAAGLAYQSSLARCVRTTPRSPPVG